jgi:hypothetical protein
VKGWLVIAGGVATAAVVLFAWLPVGALLNQRAELSTASSRLAQLSTEGRALAAASKHLSEPAVLEQLAREQYQLVAPGQRLIQVLTPSFTPSSKSTGGPFPGDPGLAPLVDPASAAVVPNGPAPAAQTAATTHARAHPGPGFVSRLVTTLEFWR